MSYSAYAQDGLETMCAAPSRPSCGTRAYTVEVTLGSIVSI